MSGINIEQTNEREIIALTQFEAIRHRPGMYIGSVLPNEEKIPIIIDNKLVSYEKNWSMGLMQTFIEIFENGLDEAKRCRGAMNNIHVTINLDTNMVCVRDEGNGFYKAHEIHSKTKKTIVRTALEELHAGSNFAENTSNILGTHGVGASCVNVLSSVFEVSTTNETHKVDYTWNDFKVVKQKITEIDKVKNPVKGTSISFIPSPDVFGSQKWDLQIITTYLSFKQMLVKNDPVINGLTVKCNVIKNNKSSDLKLFDSFIPDHIKVETKMGTLFLWLKYENGTSVSFINGSSCSGIHQKIVNDWISEYFGYNLTHHFYDTLFILNVPSKLMRFGDQNKTRYSVTRNEIEGVIEGVFKKKILQALNKSEIASAIKDEIEKRLYADNIKKIKSAQKTSKRKISDKYIAPSKRKEHLYLTEGNCLHENTEVSIFDVNEGTVKNKCISDVNIGDLVITHENNIKPVTHKTESIRKSVNIKTKLGDINCSEEHKLFVYDTTTDEFYFTEVKHINKQTHKLVQNKLYNINDGFDVIDIKVENDKTHLIGEYETCIITTSDKICVLVDNDRFKMKSVVDVKINDYICKFQ